ncbi:uncharacterized protein PHACADRAFT_27481 [Phanerochaete carnosa HHB-10118-sp]|uniref:Carboxylic ester hydrolase n=1 Tax=Phanerochaete carnosa (strain HHB-10118-sp) TaxID=650164 RepID=K5WBU9_PHACS|nr:uncharacterized protein PHACADRAFT_27481 [Phanerochaete carnosa HHB-10118-sp]EKM56690.1 hypothetical protein PHACADRAFT_27481 [Phanerochaete carnosa HHB-10118-sp]
MAHRDQRAYSATSALPRSVRIHLPSVTLASVEKGSPMMDHLLIPGQMQTTIPAKGQSSAKRLAAVRKVLMRLLAYTGLLSFLCLATADTVVDLGYAKYRGNLSFPNTVAYLGLPYAEPPVGELRWRAPLPLNTTRVSQQAGGTIVDASSYPEFCIQGTTGDMQDGDAGGAGSEDCLKVNVYAPANAKEGDKLLVYIHGGGYVFGNPANWPFDNWVHQVPSVVIVSVYYRLDSFGFLSHPAFASSSSLGDLNVGFSDQNAALHWVQEHINAFGGDPGQVTINGQSAGGSSVELHLVASGQQGLFHQAIAQSVYRTPLPSPEQQEPLFNFYAEKAGCGGSSTVSDTMACLRKAPVTALAPAQDAPFNGSYNAFHPVLDGKIIPDRPTPAILSGRFADIPLMVGATSNESLSLGATSLNSGLQTFFPALTQADLAEFNQVYAVSNFDNSSQQIRVGTGESELRCAAEIIGGASAQQRSGKTFVYRYNTANPTGGDPLVEHAAENWMMFRGTNTGYVPSLAPHLGICMLNHGHPSGLMAQQPSRL